MELCARLLLLVVALAAVVVDARRALYRRNSRHIRRMTRMYDWEVDENGGFRPVIDGAKVQRSTKTCANDSYILETILRKYNRHKIPGGSVKVKVEVWVQEITTISDITSDFQLDIYISEMWLDPALDYAWMDPCKYNLSLNSILLEKLWTPNSCFINSKTADIHKSPFPNIFLLIYANGSVWTNYRLKLQGPCSMDLTRFPFDNVTCSLTFESFNYNTDEVEMSWSDLGVSKMREKMELADYELMDIENVRNTEPYPAGYWHELTMKFHFKRRAGWYILQAYLPTYLTICISWISFALGSKAIPARTMLGVNSLLAMTFQFGNIIRNLPRVSYVKAIDVWMLSCMTFVFCSLLELAWVGYLSREEEDIRRPMPAPPSTPLAVQPVKVTTPKSPASVRPPHYVPPYEPTSGGGTLLRRAPKQSGNEEEHALLSLRDNDYGYIPPGYGLNGNLKSALSSLAGPCACHQPPQKTNCCKSISAALTADSDESQAVFAYEQASYRRRQRDRLAHQIDIISACLFPGLFSVFNIAYWYHYLRN
uniref:Ligand-gated ion channel 50 n=1 Tax=Steinernema glaseri TaxID=37863 RepID=A0A1I7ZYM6_9BILA